MEQKECSKTSAYKIQTPGNYPKESTKRKQTCLDIHMIIIICNVQQTYRRLVLRYQLIFQKRFWTSIMFDSVTQFSTYWRVGTKPGSPVRGVRGVNKEWGATCAVTGLGTALCQSVSTQLKQICTTHTNSVPLDSLRYPHNKTGNVRINVTGKQVRVTIVAMEKQYVLHTLSVSL